ncbi:low temperature requirement protein A [Luethyella okanaganae]|uniref:Low temperature requirement protein A n=1 Tax=Luethyella okanaganae TaxID=69372 RepID=A0ABW1VJC5_9MICO
MAALGFTHSLLRADSGEEAHRVTFVELFFDLVFVFAITQLSHLLIEDPSLDSHLHTIMITLAVWWVWVYTTWAANWLDPQRGWVRTMLIALMLLGLLMSGAIPEAFGEKGLLFAAAFVLMQVGRSVFTAFAFAPHQRASALNFARISFWLVASGVFWIWGGLVPPGERVWLWSIALVLEYLGPIARFRVPFLGYSDPETWRVSGSHFAERVSLFFIIALGESVIVTGSAFSREPLDWLHLAAFLAAFTGTVLMWLLYFNHGERGGSEYIRQASSSGLVARLAYTYIPVVMVVGIVLTAVGDELVLDDPLGEHGGTTAGNALVICSASAIYLLGNVLFKRAVGASWLVSHFVGIAVLGGFFLLHPVLAPLALTWLANAVMLGVVLADELAFRRERAQEELLPE